MMKKLLFIALLFFSNESFAQPKIITHRGHWDIENGAHNSLSSLFRAHEIGAFGTEFDIWLTSDGELVVFHDETINNVPIATSTYEELKDLKISNGEVLPTLDNFLVFAKNFPDLRLILEVKSNIKGEDYAEKVAKSVVEKVEEHELSHRTDFIAFSLDICKQLAKIRPNLNIAYLSGDKSPEELSLLGINYHQSMFFQNPELVKQAQDNGLTVNVWTVNDPENMQRLIKMGVDYITTDNPIALKKLID